ncbi:EspA/EspE family type VII secretion system effector [Mycobacterium aquaticum]|uniref:ESX-1 secretion-associated protein EspA/EspE-like domain-containing protein n=1 Tax=Mycobacterium aquaticum TaxID=1927124 RepID=A0A1X0B394_9MYCO|nr:EspA/EspE family type VII secretion system effector [Mycobacterium aquaticum]ORA36316.1 hypothetical protein BST13_12265 [Mycobacterium aquaticum]
MGGTGDIAKTGKELIEGRGPGEGILDAGRNVIEGMKTTTGTGTPDDGSTFGAAAEQLGKAGDTLKSAFPDDSWRSSGSSAYAARNHEQLSRTSAMIEADHTVATVLARESEQIWTTRENLDGQSDWLADMGQVTTAIGNIPYVGKASQTATEIAMVARAVGASTEQLLTMQQNVDANAAELHGAVAKYADIARDTKPGGDDGGTDESTPRAAAPGHPEAANRAPTAPATPTAESQPAPVQPQQGTTPAAGARPTAVGGGDMAAVMAGTVVGSILGPLGGILGGITQAASQALQAAVQAATQTVQGVTQGIGQAQPYSATLDERAEKLDAADDGKDEQSGKDDEHKLGDKPGKDAKDRSNALGTAVDKGEKGGNPGTPDAGAVVAEGAGPTDKGAAKTLPPDLGAGEFSAGAFRAPARAEVDLEQTQLSVPAAVRLDDATPGSTSVTGT